MYTCQIKQERESDGSACKVFAHALNFATKSMVWVCFVPFSLRTQNGQKKEKNTAETSNAKRGR